MVEKKEKIVCPVHLKIGSNDFLGSLRTWKGKLVFKPANEKQLKEKLKEL